jgi:hypothetical protein
LSLVSKTLNIAFFVFFSFCYKKKKKKKPLNIALIEVQDLFLIPHLKHINFVIQVVIVITPLPCPHLLVKTRHGAFS